MGETLIVMLSLPFSLVGGVLIMAVLGFHWSVATGVGFSALAGVASEIGVIMLLYLNNAWGERKLSWGGGAGATIMRRTHGGGMISATALALLVIPASYSLWQEAVLRSEARDVRARSCPRCPGGRGRHDRGRGQGIHGGVQPGRG